MDAVKFLKEKGIDVDENHRYVVGDDRGKWELGKMWHVDLPNLLEEYAQLKAHEIMIMKNK